MREDSTGRARKINDALSKEADEPECWWWLSFCDPKRPSGSQFLGVSIVRARGFATAINAAHSLGCNPGGEVQGMPAAGYIRPPETHVNRLLSRPELAELDPIWEAQRDGAA